jgi:hypothetical protein
MGRLEGVEQTPFVQQLLARATSFLRLVSRWEDSDPGDSERSSVVRRVLDLQIDLMKAGYESVEAPLDS